MRELSRREGYHEKYKKIYHYLNAFGLTPWIALHLIYVVILSLFAWLNNNGFSQDAIMICESLFANFFYMYGGYAVVFAIFMLI